ncbi:hypothetical protein PYCC9005_002392 [Savitreella phatthalungensis]
MNEIFLTTPNGSPLLDLLHPQLIRGLHASQAIQHHYSYLNGYRLHDSLTQAQRFALHATRGIDVSPNDEFTFSKWQVQRDSPWHLSRLNAQSPPPSELARFGLDGAYVYDSAYAGQATELISLDSGVDCGNDYLFPRVVCYNRGKALRDWPGMDIHGHGTGVAGLAVSSRHGAAREAHVLPINLLIEGSPPRVDTVLESISKVLQRLDSFSMIQRSSKAFVAVIAAEMRGNLALDMGVMHLLHSGVLVVAAAGNMGEDACNFSPQRVPMVLTVGGVSPDDTFSSFSNHGSCVDILSPSEMMRSTAHLKGSTHLSAHATHHSLETLVTGTSFGAGVVAGVALLHALRFARLHSSRIAESLSFYLVRHAALHGQIKGLPPDTPNKLIHYLPKDFEAAKARGFVDEAGTSGKHDRSEDDERTAEGRARKKGKMHSSSVYDEVPSGQSISDYLIGKPSVRDVEPWKGGPEPSTIHVANPAAPQQDEQLEVWFEPDEISQIMGSIDDDDDDNESFSRSLSSSSLHSRPSGKRAQ